MNIEKTISIDGPFLKVETSKDGVALQPAYFKASEITAVTSLALPTFGRMGITGNPSTYEYEDAYVVDITFNDGYQGVGLRFDLNETLVSHPTWTLNKAGLDQAISDINALIYAGTSASANGPAVEFIETIFFVRNNGGTLQTSPDEITWTENLGPHIPANINSFYVMNLGLDGDATTYSDISIDVNGTTRTMNPNEVDWNVSVADGKDNLTGNITVTPAVSHVVKIGYIIKA